MHLRSPQVYYRIVAYSTHPRWAHKGWRYHSQTTGTSCMHTTLKKQFYFYFSKSTVIHNSTLLSTRGLVPLLAQYLIRLCFSSFLLWLQLG